MTAYRIYHVWSGSIKAGKLDLFAQWYARCGSKALAAIPGVQSVRAFARQFGLGPDALDVEIWMEIESYGTYDRLDADMMRNPDKYAWWSEIEEFLEQRNSRIMGDFPESALLAQPDDDRPPDRQESQP